MITTEFGLEGGERYESGREGHKDVKRTSNHLFLKRRGYMGICGVIVTVQIIL